MKILVLNAGSSSQKSSLYEIQGNTLPKDPPQPLWEAQIDWTHQGGYAELKVKTIKSHIFQESFPSESRRADTIAALKTLWSGPNQVIAHPQEIDIIGHRVVHGGQNYTQSTVVNPDVKAEIARLATFAPLHNPANLEGIEAVESILGLDIPQVAVFDTAFHSHLPPAAFVYPGPYEWVEQGIRRYGFHGISHQYCAQRAAQILGCDLQTLRLVTCHLGNGCSLAAIREGQCLDTTMGFTPLEGLMMGSRCGSIDPGILIHLLRQGDNTINQNTINQLDYLLNHASGLLGISGVSSDMREIMIEIAQGNERAQLAFDIFIHRLRSQIGSMLPSLGRLDALVFTAGIGENVAAIRAKACEAFPFLDLFLDFGKNESSPLDEDIATLESKVRVLKIHTQEDWAIAQECFNTNSSSYSYRY